MNVPVHSVLLMPTREEALRYPKGDIKLAFCNSCGFITNLAFDPTKHDYSSRYEETQGFSDTFNKFHKKLAWKLIKKHNLRKRRIIEIGCGKGDFINMLCELGNNEGYGFDPAYVEERDSRLAKGKVAFIKDLYSEKYRDYHGDFICCKMTLEHIQHTLEFMQTVRRSIGERYNSIVFFQVPDMIRILKDIGFWDIYYEHCSYFTLGSLARLFRKAHFEVNFLGKDYDDQYLMIEANPKRSEGTAILLQEENNQEISDLVKYFSKQSKIIFNVWKKQLRSLHDDGKRIVLWGGGSKGVAFLTTLGIVEEIEFAVDINPYKHGTFMAGTGQEIVAPEFLKQYQPDVVIVMNPIYTKEIGNDLKILSLDPKIIPVDYYCKTMSLESI
jgi:SAM-dependent methyltransferase